ncbi:DUF805 domain-containing protein [Acinetobacter lwoffii]|jgi:uncharacterized membrane protein YhaH (DUF805 family)|uniref:DUF805 domain-containing protein n=1 Tax=Acinetobacter lwoffii TaxID=28090 RepID=UPI00110CA135|nr:DUF805 domain-containing protein [Acinetobacter lwoffii]QGR74325.1 DUF805 domain-containing protein [Acinetobacter lwoffii]QKT99448.1 DUF805 domain-containing protein [Acinetobacter lwoffii]TMS50736.1 DUF805 domain-containing protein [Acinetobacter lwoffii]
MKGVILDYSIQHNAGVISGDDQNRYNFKGSDWRGQRPPASGDKVDFAIDTEGQAIDVYLAIGNANSTIQNLSVQLDKISNQNQSEENFNIIDWFVKGLKNYANFTGRARRKEFWFFALTQFIILIIAQILDAILGSEFLFYVLTVLALFIPALAVSIRRLHDIGKSGWWYLIGLVPLIGFILLIIWFATETKQNNNEWGQPAK